MQENYLVDQTTLIIMLLNEGTFKTMDIENCSKYYQPVPHRQWIAIAHALADKLIAQKEIVLRNDFGNWWCRYNFENPLESDPILKAIL
jgi:hypothetical protein